MNYFLINFTVMVVLNFGLSLVMNGDVTAKGALINVVVAGVFAGLFTYMGQRRMR